MSIVTAWNDGKLRAYLPESGRLIYEVPHAHHLDATAVVITECNRYHILFLGPRSGPTNTSKGHVAAL